MEETPLSRLERIPTVGRILLLCLLLPAFLLAIKLMGVAIKLLGEDQAAVLFDGVANPFAGLAVGILSTALVQSSSVTTSLIVGLVGTGQLGLETAVPLIMGANIGTSITNTIVSLGHITRGEEFRRAFAGATMHDFFNLIAVAIFLPIELATGFLRHSALWLTDYLTLGGGISYQSPIKRFFGMLAHAFTGFVRDVLGLEGWPAALLTLLVAITLLVFALIAITRVMRSLMADRLEGALNRVLARSGMLGILTGVVITATVQSSSITTSLLIPLIGAGVLSLEAAFPVTLGANIGTTVTALLASLAADKPAGLSIALVHLLFNLSGMIALYPIPWMRHLPIRLARMLADAASRNRMWVAAYLMVVFVIIPLLGILVFK